MKHLLATLLTLILIAITGYQAGNLGFSVQLSVEESGPAPQVFFCNRIDCSEKFAEVFANASTLDCAFFELEDERVRATLEHTNARLITDARKEVEYQNTKYDTTTAFMHNKFCIADNIRVLTGSWNPKNNSVQRNNIVIIDSHSLAAEYQREFDEMWSGTFNRGPRKQLNKVIFNSYDWSVHFCPEDNCQGALIEEIQQATHTIKFMTFSFTDNTVAQAMVQQNVHIQGIFEPLNTRYSQISYLHNSSAEVKYDRLPDLLHHKTIIIDNTTVVTGSYNPTKNGNTRNDENMLVIKDPVIVQAFLEEFSVLWSTSTRPEQLQ